MERVLDSRIKPKSLKEKLLNVLSSKGLVWRSPLKTNSRKRGETKQNRSVQILTKSQGKLNSSIASSILDKRQYDRETSFHQLLEEDVPLYQEAERAQWNEWATHGSVKIHPPVEATKIRQQVRRERRVHSRFASRNTNAGLLDPASNPLPVKAKARLVWLLVCSFCGNRT